MITLIFISILIYVVFDKLKRSQYHDWLGIFLTLIPVGYSQVYLDPLVTTGLGLYFVGLIVLRLKSLLGRINLSVIMLPWLVGYCCSATTLSTLVVGLLSIKFLELFIKSVSSYGDSKYFKYSLYNLKTYVLLTFLTILFASIKVHVLDLELYKLDLNIVYCCISVILFFGYLGAFNIHSEKEKDNTKLLKGSSIITKYSQYILIPLVLISKVNLILTFEFGTIRGVEYLCGIIVLMSSVQLFQYRMCEYRSKGIDHITTLNLMLITLITILSPDIDYLHWVYFIIILINFICSILFSLFNENSKFLLGLIIGSPYSPLIAFTFYVYSILTIELSFIFVTVLLVVMLLPMLLYSKFAKELCERQ